MQIFNIGALELLIILVIAFIILGPQKAIQSIRDIGRWIRNMTKSPLWREILSTSNEIRDLPKKIVDDIDFQSTIDELDNSTKDINRALQEVQVDTENKLSKLQKEINQGLQLELTDGDHKVAEKYSKQSE